MSSASSYRQMLDQATATTAVLVEVERPSPDRATVRLADPGRLNILSVALVAQLRRALDDLLADGELRSVVLTGADPGFSAGGDAFLMADVAAGLPDNPDGTTTVWRYVRGEYGAVARTIVSSDVAFLAAVNGVAAGVGLAWAGACDIVLASDRALLVPAFGRLGLLPEIGTSHLLTRALGYRGAFRAYVSGEHLDAAAALRLGLVDEVVPHSELAERAAWWCRRIAALPAHALPMAKPLLRRAADVPWEVAVELEEYAQPNMLSTRAFREAVAALIAGFDGTPRER